MGGDAAPAVVVEGAVRATRQAPSDLAVLLFGPEARIREELARYPDAADLPLQVIDAPEVIGMAEAPAAAVKTKQRSSIHRGLAAHKQGQADAFISAGNTGAVMAASLFILGRLPGVQRPTVIGFFPTPESYCIVLDVGTNIDCKPEHLVQFAQMGSVYAERVLHRPSPSVALMNVGEEPGKGNELVKSAYVLLKDTPGLNFVGNIEGRDVFRHAADVVVCDGFVGNVMLKLGESVVPLLKHLVGREMQRRALPPDQQRLVMEVLRATLCPFNYEKFGGAPLLGVDGTVLIGHGSSTARAIERMIQSAAEVARQQVAASIAAALHG